MRTARDVRDTWRSLARSPYFTIPIVLSLAFAIGANVAAFSVINALVLRPLPVEQPDRLFHVRYFGESGSSEGGNYAWFDQVRDAARSISAVFIHHRTGMNVAVDGQVERVTGTYVSGGYFAGLGISAQIGRLITPADEDGAAPNRVAVLSDDYWNTRYGRDPGVIGRTILVDNVPHEVIGVTRPGFAGVEVGRRFDVTVPIDGSDYRQGWASMALLVRLPQRGSPEAASEELTALLGQYTRALPVAAQRRLQGVELAPIANGLAAQGGVRERFMPPAAVVSVLLAVMLLLACANWAILLLARASARRRELSIRVALGSSRFRLARLAVIEGLSLAVAGGALGLLAASWIVGYLPGNQLPTTLAIDIDLRVLFLATVITLTIGLLFALAPASVAHRVEARELRSSGVTASRRTAIFGRNLVVVQVALSLMIVVAAALFGATLRSLRQQDMGFSGTGVVTFALDAEGTGIEGEPLTALHRRILARLRAIPGVESATLASVTPLSGNVDGKGISIPGFLPQSPEDQIAPVDTIGADYFTTFGIPILRGRAITEADNERAPHVALLSQSAAQYYFPGVDPIGRRMEIRGSTTLQPEIVGIVPDVMYDDLRTLTDRMFYVPFYQRYAEGEYVFAVRTSGNADVLARQIPREIATVAPNMPVLGISPVARQIDALTANERLLVTVSGFVGALALILVGIGIYGIVAYTVTRRIPELGLRVALGANARQVVWLLLRGALTVMTAGVVIGLAAGMAATQLLADLVFGVAANDPRAYAIAAAIVLGAGLLSTIVPLARALHVDPVTALRYE